MLFADSEKSSNAIVRLLNSRAAGSPRAYEEAAKIVREDADNGGVLQQFILAVISRDEDAPDSARLNDRERERYFTASRDKIRRLAELNDNPLAWYVLSMEGNDMSMLEKAAAGGNVQALNAFGTIRLTEAFKDPGISSNDLAKAQRRAYKCFKWASDQGDVNGFYNLGMCHMSGYGCKRDEKMAFECFRTAAEAGHPEAINNIGGFFRDGIVVRRNPQLSVLWFKKSSELGNEFGVLNYGLALLSGQGVEKNQAGAAKLFRYLAESRSHAEGMHLYGMCLMRGMGIDKDEKAAVGWFEKAAAKGFAMSMDNLSTCYERGIGVEPDTQKSLVWKMRARAAAGDRTAAEWLKSNEEAGIRSEE